MENPQQKVCSSKHSRLGGAAYLHSSSITEVVHLDHRSTIALTDLKHLGGCKQRLNAPASGCTLPTPPPIIRLAFYVILQTTGRLVWRNASTGEISTIKPDAVREKQKMVEELDKQKELLRTKRAARKK